MFVNLKKFAQKLGAVKRETRSHCYRSELVQNERFRPKSNVTFAAYHIEKKRFWILRLENFERKKSQKHKYRGTQPANLAESITRGFLAQPLLCMHTSRAHYPAVRLGRTDHGRLPFFACTPMLSFSLPPSCASHSRHRCPVPFTLPHTPHGMLVSTSCQ